VHGDDSRGARSWTRLVEHAAPGATVLQLEDGARVRAGDTIVLSSTDYDPSQLQVTTVLSVQGGEATISSPVVHPKFGRVTKHGGVDQRCEVAVLTKNVVFQGLPGGARGHMLFNTAAVGGAVRISGVEVREMGLPLVGRYPLHFHLMGAAGEGCYLRSSSVWDSVNRAVTVHGTMNVTVEGLATYDTQGHSMFLEDGSERDNTFEGNLVMATKHVTRAGDRLGSDVGSALSGFWITNPGNSFMDNVVSSTNATGYWIHTRGRVRGMSAGMYPNVRPSVTPLKLFRGNSAHSLRSCTQIEALSTDAGDVPQSVPNSSPNNYGPLDATGQKAWIVYDGFVCHHSYNSGGWFRTSRMHMTGTKWADLAGAFQISTNGQHPSPDSTSKVVSSVFVGQTDNMGNGRAVRGIQNADRLTMRSCPADMGIAGFRLYDGPVAFSNNSFYSYRDGACNTAHRGQVVAPITTRLYNVFAMSTAMSFSGSKFCDVQTRVVVPDVTANGGLSATVNDVDGSISGYRGSTIVMNRPFYNDGRCAPFLKASANMVACPHSYSTLEVSSMPNLVRTVRVTRVPEEDAYLDFRTPQTMGGQLGALTSIAVSVGGVYSISWPEGTPTRFTVQLTTADRGTRVHLAICLPRSVVAADIRVRRGNAEMGGSLSMMNRESLTPSVPVSVLGDAWWVGGNRSLHTYMFSQGVLYLTLEQTAKSDLTPELRNVCPQGGCDFAFVSLSSLGDGAELEGADCGPSLLGPPEPILRAWNAVVLPPPDWEVQRDMCGDVDLCHRHQLADA
jgi:cell migration-inducing and hyaluronan-binding protein